MLINSGEHLPVPIIKKLQEKLPKIKIYCIYGLTEVAGRLCILDSKYLSTKIGSVGKPLARMKITVRDESHKVVGPNQEGQVYVKGPLLTTGYINNDEVNKREFTKWGFATGDFGRLDTDGFLYLEGRKDDIIKVGGEKVSLKIIDEVLYDYPVFKEFVVYPVYDTNMGTLPALKYVLNQGQIFNRLDLIKFISAKLPQTHLPVKFEEVSEIERTSSGKIARQTNLVK
jgi:O-succinylbenzoic acid--CoA ligase